MKKNNQTALNVLAVVVGMFGLAYASVPLYDAFCKLTGYAGTPNTLAVKPSDRILKREMNIMFTTDVSPNINLKFTPLQSKVKVKIGEQKLVFFEVENLSNKKYEAVATYNVVPEQTGQYFSKLKCFCFDKQIIKPYQKITFPVSFYIDPTITDDKNLDDVKTITLAYTFFKAD